jgi:hypothetical protein
MSSDVSRPDGIRLGIDPIDEESFLSFVYRLALRLHLTSAVTIRKQCGMKGNSNRPSSDELARLADFARVDIIDLENLTFGLRDADVGMYRGRNLPSQMFTLGGNSVSRFVCPACLADAPFHRAIWDFTAISACPVHLVELAATCDACGEGLRWEGGDLAVCRCGQLLSQIRTQRLTDREAEGTKVFHGLLGDERFSIEADGARNMPPFRDLDDVEIIDFLYRFGAETLWTSRASFSHLSHEIGLGGHMALTNGLRVLDPWPEAFHAALDALCERSAPAAPEGFLWWPDKPAVKVLGKWLLPIYDWVDRLAIGHGVAIEAALDDFRKSFGPSKFLLQRRYGPRLMR